MAYAIMFVALRNPKLSLMNDLFEKRTNSEYSETELYFDLTFHNYT